MKGVERAVKGKLPLLFLPAAFLLIGCNRPPAVPAAPSGPDSGRANYPHVFTAVTDDPDGDSVSYQFDWGDGRLSSWTRLTASGSPDSVTVTWATGGHRPVRVRARDSHGRESGWSAPHPFAVSGDGGILWSVELGGTAAGAPVLSGANVVFPVAGGRLVCLDTTGTEVWTVTLPDEINGTPAADESGRLFVSCANARVYAYGPGGKREWERLVGFGCSAPALGPDGRLYAGATDGRLYAFDAADGRILGFFEADGEARSPVAVRPDGVILFGCDDGHLYAVGPDLSLRWRFNVGGRIRRSPALDDDGRVYVSSESNLLHAVDGEGRLLWTAEAGARVRSEPAVGPVGSVWFGADDNRLHRLNRDGEVVMRFETGGFVRACPTLGANGRVYLGSYDSRLYALDEAGEMLWRIVCDGAVLQSALLDDRGRVYFTAGGTAYAVGSIGAPADSPWPTGRQNARRTGSRTATAGSHATPGAGQQ